MTRPSSTVLLVAALFFTNGTPALARIIFVNNRMGSDVFDGAREIGINEQTGPVRTIGRALKLAKKFDEIVVANTGVPYYESISLVGEQHSGSPDRPFRIVGNGAVLSGAAGIPPSAWEEVGTDLWRVTPYRKGHYQLIRRGKAVDELRPGPMERWKELPDLQEHQWCAWKGAIYYRSERLGEPAEQRFAFARKGCGITLYSVHDVVVTGFSIQHFRVDGVNANDLVINAWLANLISTQNGRSGLVVSGASTVHLISSRIEQNRDYSIWLREAAALSVEESEFDVQPVVEPPVDEGAKP